MVEVTSVLVGVTGTTGGGVVEVDVVVGLMEVVVVVDVVDLVVDEVDEELDLETVVTGTMGALPAVVVVFGTMACLPAAALVDVVVTLDGTRGTLPAATPAASRTTAFRACIVRLRD